MAVTLWAFGAPGSVNHMCVRQAMEMYGQMRVLCMNVLLHTQLRDVAQRVGSRFSSVWCPIPASPLSSCLGSPVLALHQSPEPLLFSRLILPLRVNLRTRKARGRSALSGICSCQLTRGRFQTAYVHLRVVIWRLLETLWESVAFFWTYTTQYAALSLCHLPEALLFLFLLVDAGEWMCPWLPPVWAHLLEQDTELWEWWSWQSSAQGNPGGVWWCTVIWASFPG